MTAIAEATEKEMIQAIWNCYGCAYGRFNAIIHYNRYGVFPFNPQLN